VQLRPVIALAAYRAVAGISVSIAPYRVGRVIGMDPQRNEVLPYVSRLAGIRELVLGIGALQAEGKTRRRWLQLALVCDISDTASGLIAGRHGQLDTVPGVSLTAVSALLTLAALATE
jgi:hypothetical protein